jgi:membrane-bound lytic murein transglycosylase A
VPRRAAALLLAAALLGCRVSEPPPVRYVPASFADLPDWPSADPRPALEAFRKSCAALRAVGARCARPGAATSAPRVRDEGARSAPLRFDDPAFCDSLARACATAAEAEAPDTASARAFFERHFVPHRVLGRDGAQGLFTGYYEPRLDASRNKRAGFTVPIYAKPREARDGATLPSRAEIESGTVARDWTVLFWAADPIDVFFLHVQGSGRLVLAEGGFARVSYAGNNGHGYVAIGRLMRERGLLPEGGTSMQAIRAWLRVNPEAGRALMQENPRYIFFAEIPERDGPKGQQGVPLTELASLAVDPAFIPMGLPLWLDTNWPAEKAKLLRLLVVAQDTGSAIKGAVRGDIFFGSGRLAPDYAGRMAERGSYFLLMPKR